MKAYDLNTLLKEAKEQNYKLAALENTGYQRLVSFNNMQTPVAEQLKKIFTKLKSDALPDGAYCVLMANSISKTKDALRYPVTKGKASLNEVAQASNGSPQPHPYIINTKAEEVLSWDSAVKMNEEIASLKAQVFQLQFENNQLHKQVEELEAELEEQEEGVSEGSGASNGQNGIVTFLQETTPTLIAAFDRWAELQEKKLDLQKQDPKKAPIKQAPKQTNGIGSEAHVVYIRTLYAEDKDDALNAELDKLENSHPELYAVLCNEFGMTEEEPENE